MVKVIISTDNWSSWPDFGGATWVPMQYVLGFLKLGVEVYWVDHLKSIDPRLGGHSINYLVHTFDSTASEFGFQEQYSILIQNSDEQRFFGMPLERFQQLASEADLLVSISGTGLPKGSPLLRVPRRVYIDLDPGFTQVWAQQVDMGLEQYNYFFTVGQNVGRADFKIPTQDIRWQPIFPPVVLDFWPACIDENCQRFSTIADFWGKQWAKFEGKLHGGKREEFLRFIRVPVESKQRFEVALYYSQEDYEQLGLLNHNQWIILNPQLYAGNPLSYREFIQYSRAEFSVAKSGYVQLNTGWISDRTACYLASGKPAIVQSTGFEGFLPVGEGLLTFRTLEEAVAGIDAINRDYLRHCNVARQIAEQYFHSDLILSSLLERVGL